MSKHFPKQNKSFKVIEVHFERKFHADDIMKILLDEMYTGFKEYFEIKGWEVSTARDEGLEGVKDREIVEYAKNNEFLIVTQDQKPADLADLEGVPYVLISKRSIFELIDSKIGEKYPDIRP